MQGLVTLLVVAAFGGAAVRAWAWYLSSRKRALEATNDFVEALNERRPSPYNPRPSSGGIVAAGLAGFVQGMSRGIALGQAETDPSIEALRLRAKGLYRVAALRAAAALAASFAALIVALGALSVLT